jgi:hypothetical protein
MSDRFCSKCGSEVYVTIRRDEYEKLKKKTEHSISLFGRSWVYGSKKDCTDFREYAESQDQLIRDLVRERKRKSDE